MYIYNIIIHTCLYVLGSARRWRGERLPLASWLASKLDASSSSLAVILTSQASVFVLVY